MFCKVLKVEKHSTNKGANEGTTNKGGTYSQICDNAFLESINQELGNMYLNPPNK